MLCCQLSLCDLQFFNCPFVLFIRVFPLRNLMHDLFVCEFPLGNMLITFKGSYMLLRILPYFE